MSTKVPITARGAEKLREELAARRQALEKRERALNVSRRQWLSRNQAQLAAADADRSARARAYAAGGAAAISVLTEPDRFAGDIAHAREVVAAVEEFAVPVMRKDFLTDVRQILEARAAGASGVLLIAAILEDAALESMLDCALEHSMFVLLEAFDSDDLTRCAAQVAGRYSQAAADGQLLIGVNT